MGRLPLWTIGVVSACWTSAALAQAPALDLAAPASCPDRAALARRLDELLAADASGATIPAATVSVRIALDGDTFAAEVVILEGDEATRRSLRDPDCAVVAEAVAVVVAITLVPGLDPSAGASAEPSEIATQPDAAPTLGGSLRLGGYGSYGALPGVVIGGELGGAVRYDALRIEVTLRGVPVALARFAAAPGLGGDLSLVLGSLRACAAPSVDTHVELLACGGVQVGAALGRAVGITRPSDSAAPWVALEAAAGAIWLPWRSFGFYLELELLVPVVRPVFTIEGLGVLWRPEPVAGAIRLGLEARFE